MYQVNRMWSYWSVILTGIVMVLFLVACSSPNNVTPTTDVPIVPTTVADSDDEPDLPAPVMTDNTNTTDDNDNSQPVPSVPESETHVDVPIVDSEEHDVLEVESSSTPCILDADVISRSEMAADQSLQSHTTFKQWWIIRNSGTCTWDSLTNPVTLIFVGEDSMENKGPVTLSGRIEPNGEVMVTMDLVAPNGAGIHESWWQLHNSEGQPFGHQFIATVAVSGDPAPDRDVAFIRGAVVGLVSPTPRMAIYAIDQSTNSWSMVQTMPSNGQTPFSIEITPGNYVVFAWELDGNGSGKPLGYFTEADRNHLARVTVISNTAVEGIQVRLAGVGPCDGFAVPASPDGRFPAFTPNLSECNE